MDIHICESRMTLEERQEAINVARLLKPEKPSFHVFLRASNMQLNYVVSFKLYMHIFYYNLFQIFLLIYTYVAAFACVVCADFICSEVLEWRRMCHRTGF